MESSRTTTANTEVVESLSPVEFDVEDKSFQATYDSTRDSASLAVVSAVSSALGREPRNLPPLQSAIETEALDKLATKFSTDPENYGRISFGYEGLEITVTGEGVIEANPVGNS